MKLNDYNTLYGILSDITPDDFVGTISDIDDFVPAPKTRKYLRECQRGRTYDPSVAKMYLAEDFSGC